MQVRDLFESVSEHLPPCTLAMEVHFFVILAVPHAVSSNSDM